MKEVGLADTIFYSDDGTYTQGYIDAAGEAAEGSYASFVDTSSFANAEALEAFKARYETEFGVAPDELGPFHAHAYDAASIIMNAVESVATVDADGNLVINREELILAIRNTTEYAGLTGTLTCNPENGECGAGLIGANLVEGGAWVAVEVPAELQYGAVAAGGEEASAAEYATVVDAVAAQPNLSTLASVLPMAGADAVAALTGEGPFTIFAPSDDAFNAFMAANAELVNQALADPTILAGILLYHVAPGNLLAADVAASSEIVSLNGAPLAITVDGDNVMINGMYMVITADIVAGNGVVHIIDGVLLPPTE